MALIKCEECGNMISDKATSCPNCGVPVTRKIKCQDCGTEFREGLMSCPTCGCPVQQPHQTPSQPSYQAPPSLGIHQFASSNMDIQQRVQRFIMTNSKYLPESHMEEIRSTLLSLNAQQMSSVECIDFKDPTTMLLISIFLGGLGVDRFMLGDAKNGVFKLLLSIFFFLIITLLALFVWWIIDLIKMKDMTKQYNYNELTKALSYV